MAETKLPPGVRVKALEWESFKSAYPVAHTSHDRERAVLRALSDRLWYSLYFSTVNGVWHLKSIGNNDSAFGTKEQAKAAAQADYERRLLACLEVEDV